RVTGCRDRRRHGQRRRRGDRGAADRHGRAIRPCLCADLQRGVHLRHHGGRAGVQAPRTDGEEHVSGAQWRRGMSSSAAAAAARDARSGSMAIPVPVRQADAAPVRSGDPWTWATARRRSLRWRHVIVLAAVLIYPFIATPFFTFQIGAQSLALGLIALSLTFLG